MGDGFTVETAELIAVAGRIDAVAGQVSTSCAPVPAATQAAASANPGLLTSPALAEIGAVFAQAATQLAGQLTGHAAKLRANAQAYQDVELRNAEQFRPGG